MADKSRDFTPSVNCRSAHVQRHELKDGYRKQLPSTSDARVLIRVHLNHLIDTLSALSALRLIRVQPISFADLRRQTLFQCAEICVEAIDGLLGNDLDVFENAELVHLWPFFAAHFNRLSRGNSEEDIVEPLSIHLSFFAAAALAVTARCNSSFQIEREWKPVWAALFPGVSLDTLTPRRLADIMIQALRSERS